MSTSEGPSVRTIAAAVVVAVVVAVVAGILALLGATKEAKATFPGDNGKIAFERNNFRGDVETWIMKPGGSGKTRLTARTALDPAFSPDGTKIAYMGIEEGSPTTDIYVMNSNVGLDSGKTNVTNSAESGEREPAFSPNGKRIVFSVYDSSDSAHELHTIPATGGQPTPLTDTPADEVSPDWSPDGKTIAYAGYDGVTYQIYTIPAGGGAPTQLTSTTGFSQATHPSWSPDGKTIAYHSGNGDIYTVPADKSAPPRPVATTSSREEAPQWSPDGEHIVFHMLSERDGRGQLDIWRMKVDGTERRQLTDTAAWERVPVWQPTPPQPIRVTASKKFISPNQKVTFKAVRKDGSLVKSNWSGGGTPESGTGTTFTTRFNVSPGFQGRDKTVSAQAVISGATAQREVKVMKPSGTDWVGQYPGSKSIDSLAQPFQGNVQRFDTALDNAGATRKISVAYRPSERAHLMYYSSRIARSKSAPRDVPTPVCKIKNSDHDPIYIAWAHYNKDGTYDDDASLSAAKQMVSGPGSYRIGTNPVAHPSRHESRQAIDWNISWPKTLKIAWGPNGGPNGEQAGDIKKITTRPRTGMNRALWQVGRSYDVIKYEDRDPPPKKRDPPHWSIDGK